MAVVVPFWDTVPVRKPTSVIGRLLTGLSDARKCFSPESGRPWLKRTPPSSQVYKDRRRKEQIPLVAKVHVTFGCAYRLKEGEN